MPMQSNMVLNRLPLSMQKDKKYCTASLASRLLFVVLLNDFLLDLLKFGNRPVYGRNDIDPDSLFSARSVDERPPQHLPRPSFLEILAQRRCPAVTAHLPNANHSNAVLVHVQSHLHRVPLPDHK